MRRVKTQEDLDNSCCSETKRRMTREQHKRLKIEQLKIKFKNTFRKINQFKHQNQEDIQQLNQLMIRSQRIEQRAHESREKTKLLLTDSLDGRRRVTLPSVLEIREISAFQLKNQAGSLRIAKQQSIEIVQDNNKAEEQEHHYLKCQTMMSIITSQNDQPRNQAEEQQKNIEIKPEPIDIEAECFYQQSKGSSKHREQNDTQLGHQKKQEYSSSRAQNNIQSKSKDITQMSQSSRYQHKRLTLSKDITQISEKDQHKVERQRYSYQTPISKKQKRQGITPYIWGLIISTIMLIILRVTA